MCLVSYVPRNGQIVLTSNRDESISRQKPLPVDSYAHSNKTLTYPKDIAGGTWITHDNNSNAIILLNGAHKKHVRASSYRKSRGLIVLELMSAPDSLQAWQDIDLQDIEPFTLVHFTDSKLYDHVWDGIAKVTTEMDTTKAHLWMSATLYTRDYYKNIQKRFEALDHMDADKVDAFHSSHLYEDNGQDHIIPTIKTVSISVITIDANISTLTSEDRRVERPT